MLPFSGPSRKIPAEVNAGCRYMTSAGNMQQADERRCFESKIAEDAENPRRKPSANIGELRHSSINGSAGLTSPLAASADFHRRRRAQTAASLFRVAEAILQYFRARKNRQRGALSISRRRALRHRAKIADAGRTSHTIVTLAPHDIGIEPAASLLVLAFEHLRRRHEAGVASYRVPPAGRGSARLLLMARRCEAIGVASANGRPDFIRESTSASHFRERLVKPCYHRHEPACPVARASP